MQKNNTQAVLTTDGTPATQAVGAQSFPATEICKHLNFKVPPEFHREFKIFAASHDISMTALLIEAFNMFRKSQS